LPDVICDTSPIQYLHQLELLHILPTLAGNRVIVPPAVLDELTAGRALGINLPDLNRLEWVNIRQPVSVPALPLVNDLGPGETEVLMLGLESPEAVVVLDDALARQIAETLNLRLTGTLGLLLDAKRAGLISAITPFLDRLEALRFRLASHTRTAVLKLAAENAET
jgi:predicted nucleic acid-binding protein